MEVLREKIKKVQDASRYEHTLAVAYTAACLASVHGADIVKALRAGLLHDCAKCILPVVQLAMCEQYNIAVSDVERRSPFLLHAKLGARLAEDIYEEQDADVLNAVRNHTTGRPGMSVLEKIIFIADYIEPGRDKAPCLSEIRKMAFTDLDAALIKILQDTLLYLQNSGGDIDPATEETLNYYIQK